MQNYIDAIVVLLEKHNNLTTEQISHRLNIDTKTIGGVLWYLGHNRLGVGRFDFVHWKLYKKIN